MPVTNAIESLHMQLRKIIKARGRFPSDEAALRLIWLAPRDVVARWTGSRHDWKSAMTQFGCFTRSDSASESES